MRPTTTATVAAVTLALSSSGLLALAGTAAADSASGDVSSFTITPASLAAGSNPNLGIDMKFTNASGDSAKALTMTLAPGLWASLAAAPAGTQIGTGTLNVAVPQLGLGSLSADATLKMIAPPPGAPANALTGVEIDATALGTVNVAVQGYVVIDSQGPSLQLVFPSLPNTVSAPLLGTLAIQINEVNLTLDGAVTSASDSTSGVFTRLPTSDAPATSRLSVTSYDGATGSGATSFTPTGTPAYTPVLSTAAAQVTDSAGDASVTFGIKQPAGQAGSSGVSLVIPGSELSLSNYAIGEVSNGATVGQAVLFTPLLSAPIDGTFSIGGGVLSPVATISFPAFGISFSGTVSDILQNPTVDFTGIPDVPFTGLQITLDGGSQALFSAFCNGASGAAAMSFTSQWRGLSYTPAATPLSVSGCSQVTQPSSPSAGTNPVSKGPPVKFSGLSGGAKNNSANAKQKLKVRASALKLTGLSNGRPRLSFTLSRLKGSIKFKSVTVRLPSGLSFCRRAKAGLGLSGAKLKGGSLCGRATTLQFKTPAAKVKLALSGSDLAETRALRNKVDANKVKRLSGGVTARAGKRAETLSFRFKQVS